MPYNYKGDGTFHLLLYDEWISSPSGLM